RDVVPGTVDRADHDRVRPLPDVREGVSERLRDGHRSAAVQGEFEAVDAGVRVGAGPDQREVLRVHVAPGRRDDRQVRWRDVDGEDDRLRRHVPGDILRDQGDVMPALRQARERVRGRIEGEVDGRGRVDGQLEGRESGTRIARGPRHGDVLRLHVGVPRWRGDGQRGRVRIEVEGHGDV